MSPGSQIIARNSFSAPEPFTPETYINFQKLPGETEDKIMKNSLTLHAV